MKVNPNAASTADAFKSGFASVTPTPTACDTGCGAPELAAYDVGMWKKSVEDTLPLGQASIFWAMGEGTTAGDPNRRQLGVMISWRENERAGTKTDAIDATKGTASGGAGTAATCPAGRICHLQYIPVSARCAPYDDGSGIPSFYCSYGRHHGSNQNPSTCVSGKSKNATSHPVCQTTAAWRHLD